MTSGTLKGALLAAAAAVALAAGPALAQDVSACLITKTETNPFFVKMREGAQAKADELGVKLTALAGREDGDNEGQVAAMESCIADGVNGILLVPSDSAAIVDTVKLARDNGVMVIALDTPLDPIDAADATLATDNFKAGELIGAWAKAQLGDKAADAKIAYLDLSPVQPTVDVLRDQGFMQGFGIDLGDPEEDRRRDRRAQRLPRRDHRQRRGRAQGDGELPAEGPGHQRRLHHQRAGRRRRVRGAEGRRQGTDVLLVSVDGGCPGVKDVAAGVIGATSQQYPLLMASMGIEAIKKFAESRRDARRDRGARLLRHRRRARHRQAGRGHRVDRHQGRPGEVLGLTG